MVERVIRTLSRTLEEVPFWTLAVRAGKFSPEGILFLAAHVHLAAAAVRAYYDALGERYDLGPYHGGYRLDCSDMVNQPIEHPQFVWPWVPDAISTVRGMSTLEHAAHQWRQALPRTPVSLADVLALRRLVGRVAQTLEAFAAFVEAFDAAAAVPDPTLGRRY